MTAVSSGSWEEEEKWKVIHGHWWLAVICSMFSQRVSLQARARWAEGMGGGLGASGEVGQCHPTPWHRGLAASCPSGGKNVYFKKQSGNLSISWSWAWISPQKRLALAAAERAQSNFTEQPTVSLSELIAAKVYCSIWTESKFPLTNLRLQRESSQTEGNDSLPKGKDLRNEDFQTLSPDCLPLLQLLISNYFNQNNYIFLNWLFCVPPPRWVQRGKKHMEIYFKSSSNI